MDEREVVRLLEVLDEKLPVCASDVGAAPQKLQRVEARAFEPRRRDLVEDRTLFASQPDEDETEALGDRGAVERALLEAERARLGLTCVATKIVAKAVIRADELEPIDTPERLGREGRPSMKAPIEECSDLEICTADDDHALAERLDGRKGARHAELRDVTDGEPCAEERGPIELEKARRPEGLARQLARGAVLS